MRPALSLCVLLSIFCAPHALSAQSTAHELEARLRNKPLYLRGRWPADDLRFDAAGQLIGPWSPASFTVCGFELRKLSLNRKGITLEGLRIGLEFEQGRANRVPMQLPSGYKTKDEKTRIQIAAPASGDYGPALSAIFADGLSDLTPSLPASWQRFARRTFLSPDQRAALDSASPLLDLPHPERGTKSPAVLHAAEPEYTEQARVMRYSSHCRIGATVGPDGVVISLLVQTPCGLGLDERAMEAVSHYVFSPATLDGQPVNAQLSIDVSFQIY